VLEQEHAVRDRRRAPPVVAGPQCRLGKRREEHRVPLREDLVVDPGSRAFLAGREQSPAAAFDDVRTADVGPCVDAVRDRAALEVAFVLDSPVHRRIVRPVAENLREFARGPRVVRTLLVVAVRPLGIGILGAEEPATGMSHP
jgi:hypothetical protein